jgi:large subunit ribosomal protein L2
MSTLIKLLNNLTIAKQLINVQNVNHQIVRTAFKFVDKPKPGVGGKQYRRIVHFPENLNDYTVKPLDTTHLAGRDPITGRLVAKGIGGGLKHKYHWIEWIR